MRFARAPGQADQGENPWKSYGIIRRSIRWRFQCVSVNMCQFFFYVQAHYFGCISQLPRIVFSGPTINQNSMFNHDHEPKITLNPIYVPIFVGSVLPITWGLKPYCWWYSQLYIPWNHTYCGLNPPNISSWFHQYHQLTFQSYPVNIPIN